MDHQEMVDYGGESSDDDDNLSLPKSDREDSPDSIAAAKAREELAQMEREYGLSSSLQDSEEAVDNAVPLIRDFDSTHSQPNSPRSDPDLSAELSLEGGADDLSVVLDTDLVTTTSTTDAPPFGDTKSHSASQLMPQKPKHSNNNNSAQPKRSLSHSREMPKNRYGNGPVPGPIALQPPILGASATSGALSSAGGGVAPTQQLLSTISGIVGSTSPPLMLSGNRGGMPLSASLGVTVTDKRDDLSSNHSSINSKTRTDKKYAFFIMRSNNEENVMTSMEQGVWATQDKNEKVLNQAYESHDKVILFFSVCGSHHFQGYCEMVSSIGSHKSKSLWDSIGNRRPKWGGTFRVRWLKIYDLRFQDTNSIINPFNENKPVRLSKDGTMLSTECGLQLKKMFDEGVARFGHQGSAILRRPILLPTKKTAVQMMFSPHAQTYLPCHGGVTVEHPDYRRSNANDSEDEIPIRFPPQNAFTQPNIISINSRRPIIHSKTVNLDPHPASGSTNIFPSMQHRRAPLQQYRANAAALSAAAVRNPYVIAQPLRGGHSGTRMNTHPRQPHSQQHPSQHAPPVPRIINTGGNRAFPNASLAAAKQAFPTLNIDAFRPRITPTAIHPTLIIPGLTSRARPANQFGLLTNNSRPVPTMVASAVSQQTIASNPIPTTTTSTAAPASQNNNTVAYDPASATTVTAQTVTMNSNASVHSNTPNDATNSDRRSVSNENTAPATGLPSSQQISHDQLKALARLLLEKSGREQRKRRKRKDSKHRSKKQKSSRRHRKRSSPSHSRSRSRSRSRHNTRSRSRSHSDSKSRSSWNRNDKKDSPDRDRDRERSRDRERERDRKSKDISHHRTFVSASDKSKNGNNRKVKSASDARSDRLVITSRVDGSVDTSDSHRTSKSNASSNNKSRRVIVTKSRSSADEGDSDNDRSQKRHKVSRSRSRSRNRTRNRKESRSNSRNRGRHNRNRSRSRSRSHSNSHSRSHSNSHSHSHSRSFSRSRSRSSSRSVDDQSHPLEFWTRFLKNLGNQSADALAAHLEAGGVQITNNKVVVTSESPVPQPESQQQDQTMAAATNQQFQRAFPSNRGGVY